MSSSDTPSNEIFVEVFGRTDVGRTREHNEDAFAVADLTGDNATLQPEVRQHKLGPKGTLFMVADGMGGAAAGEIASDMAVRIVLDNMRTRWSAERDPNDENFVRSIKNATKTANEQIHDYATSHPEFRGMGTTATIAGLLGDTLYLAQVGDSRGYLVRNGVVRQITKDQSLMQKLIEAGELTEEEAEMSERRNIILQALGPEPSIKVDLTHQQLRRGDILVLCSDGLSGQVGKDDIARVVTSEPDLTNACKALIDRANENGGPDNITVILARFSGPGLRDPNDTDEVGHRVYPLADTGHTPAMALDRIAEQEAVTQPMDVPPRPRRTPNPDAKRTSNGSKARAVNGGAPVVSAERRGVGLLIAVALGALLVLGAAYYAVRVARGATDTTSLGAPPGSPRH
jgi:protein phosphatase